MDSGIGHQQGRLVELREEAARREREVAALRASLATTKARLDCQFGSTLHPAAAAAAAIPPGHITPTWVVASSLADVDPVLRRGGAPLQVRVPDGATVVPDEAFRGCALVQIVLPSSMTEIGRRAFDGCAGLVSIAVPQAVRVIGKAAFRGCRSLSGICIPTGVTKIWGSTFEGCTSLVAMSIPPTVAWVGERAFAGCTGLTRVTIPSSVAEVGPGAFEGCSSLPAGIGSFNRSTAPNSSAATAGGGSKAQAHDSRPAVLRMQRAFARLAADGDTATPEVVDHVPGAVVLRGCLSASECDQLVRQRKIRRASCACGPFLSESSSTPAPKRRATWSTKCSCRSGADWRLHSHAIPCNPMLCPICYYAQFAIIQASEVRELHRSCSWDEGRRKITTKSTRRPATTTPPWTPPQGPPTTACEAPPPSAPAGAAASDLDAILARRQSQ